MDVDLLRPGTVPLSPDTILWFEFLLDPTLLKKHLEKSNTDPSACELIVEFLSVDSNTSLSKASSERVVDVDTPATPPPVDNITPTFTRKQLALKILALKVASYLRWNLDEFEDKLPPHIQQELMEDLVYMATDGAFTIPPQDIQPDLLNKPQVVFALSLYHRWILRFPVKAALHSKSTKMNFVSMAAMQMDNGYSPMNPNFEKVLRTAESMRMQSLKYLDDLLAPYGSTPKLCSKEPQKIKIPIMDTFAHLSEETNDMQHNWNAGNVFVSQYEFAMQIHYDICSNYFFYAQHDLAKKHILICKENLNMLEREVAQGVNCTYKNMPWGKFNYASIVKEEVYGYIKALNMGYEILNEEPSLLQKLQESVANHYNGIIPILQADNLTREIPLVHRQVVELDIQGTSSSGAFTISRDLSNRVSVLNCVRYALEGGIPSTHPDFLNKFKTVGIKFFDLLFWALAPVITAGLSDNDWKNLNIFFLHLATSTCRLPFERIDEYLKKHVGEKAKMVRNKLFPDRQLEAILNDPFNSDDENMPLPPELLANDWETPDSDFKSVPELEVGRLKKRLLEASTTDDIRMCLVKLAVTMLTSLLWKLSPTWKPPGNLGNVLASMPRGFLQDFGYIVSGAARARVEAGYANTGLTLLLGLEAEVHNQLEGSTDPALHRLSRLLSWEVLLLQINTVLNEWPHHKLNMTSLVGRCKACIAAVDSGDNVVPRSQIVEACWVCLINACEWEVEGASGGESPGAALAATCLELQRKPSRKLPRMFWEYVLTVFSNCSSGTKRLASGAPAQPPASAERAAFSTLLMSLRDPTAISVALSALARLHNILVDDSAIELGAEYVALWPAAVPNGNSYNVNCVVESIVDLLEMALRLNPYNASLLRVYGDAEMSRGRGACAMRRYMCALAAGTGYFAVRAADEGAWARRAARAAHSLLAHTQAAALAQLPDDPDYTMAFKSLAEKSVSACDAMDAYYVCVWDGTVLEVCVAGHARRGEAGRRARAVRAAGALELNANNGEDIQREAAAVRRARLLRALTKQYLA